MAKNYWLMKSEPDVYSIDDLARDKRTYWDGVRNFQARNFLRDRMRVSDAVLFYHSNAEPSGIAGLAKVVREGYPDPSAFDPRDRHYDPKSRRENPTWYVVDLEFVEKMDPFLPLEVLRKTSGLEKMLLLRPGQRLSVQPVSENEWMTIMKIAGWPDKIGAV